jgi:hypothetical protein
VYKKIVDDERRRLRDLNRRLFELHGLLVDRERRAWESLHGPVGSRELLTLLISHEHFAWLRSLSGLMARIDELVDTDDAIADADARSLLRESRRLLKSGDSGAFQDRYRDALQESPDVVIAHAKVSAILRQ